MLGSIYLTTSNPDVLLAKPDKAGNGKKIRIHTLWDKAPDGWDLDGGVMWRSFGGKKGAIQALGVRWTSHRGSHRRLPYLKLNGDDRRGGKGEIIDGDYAKVAENLSWLGVYLYLYHENDPRPLSEVKGARTIVEIPGLQPVEVAHTGIRGPACAILQIFNTPNGFRIKRDMRTIHYRGHRSEQAQIDDLWSVGLNWVPASK